MTVKAARERIVKAFRDDPDFRQRYVDNVACFLMDRMPDLCNKTRRDKIADEIIHLLFEQ